MPFQDDDLIHAFGLKAMENKKMRTLSGGTVQKVSASLAFLFSPDVLILDEPTAGLDPVAAEILKTKISKAKKERGRLILITHISWVNWMILLEIIYMLGWETSVS